MKKENDKRDFAGELIKGAGLEKAPFGLTENIMNSIARESGVSYKISYVRMLFMLSISVFTFLLIAFFSDNIDFGLPHINDISLEALNIELDMSFVNHLAKSVILPKYIFMLVSVSLVLVSLDYYLKRVIKGK